MTVTNFRGADFLVNRNKKTNSKLQKSLEKLASGYQVNRAADDAAGLAVSEKMRGIIAGLDQGVKNLNDGISYLHSVDGSAQEIHNIVHRLETIAVQAANGTYDSIDRGALDLEYQQLLEEIGQITDTSHFNGLPLFEKHLESYGLNEGVVVHDKAVVVNGLNMPLVIGYTLDDQQKEYTINVPYGTYSAEELADIIDTELYEKVPNLIIGVNENREFTIQSEPGKIDYVGGPGATLFYDATIGSESGYLLGVTTFVHENAKLEIFTGENDVMSFRLGDSDTIHSITLDAGKYTRDELIDHMNAKFNASGIPGDIKAVPETNAQGGMIIGIACKETITGLTGNFLKMDNKSSPIYDIANYGYTNNTQSVLTGKKVIPVNTEIVRGRNEYFTLDLSWYGANDAAETRRVQINLLDNSENERTYPNPSDLAARINEQLGDIPFEASISSSGTLVIKSDQYGDKCKIDLVESRAPSGHMVYDLFDKGTLNKLNPSVTTSSFRPASLTANKNLGSSIEVPANENELVFTVATDSGNKTMSVTVPQGTYTAGSLQNALNNQVAANYPDLSSKLEFKVGSTITLSAIEYSGADIKSFSVSSSSSGYANLIGGVYYTDNYTINQGSEKTYASGSGTMPSGQPAVSSTAGETTDVVTYSNQVTTNAQITQDYIIYSSISPSIKNGYQVEYDDSESIIGDERIEKFPATMTMAGALTQFTAAGKSLKDINLVLSVTDTTGSTAFNITIPKGSTKDEAIAAINNGLNGKAAARADGNNLVVTTTEKGDGVQIATGSCSMANSARKNTIASRTDAVVDETHNRVYVPSSMTIPNAASQLPYTVDSSNNKFVFKAGATTYNLTLTGDTYTSVAAIANELNARIAEADGGNPKTTVSVGSSGKSLVFKGPLKESGSFTIDTAKTTCNIYKTKNVKETAGNPNYNPATGKIEEPASVTAAGFDSHFPMTVDSSNNTITFTYKSPTETRNVTIVIPDKTYNSASECAQAISNVVSNDPALKDIISASYASGKGLTFTTKNGGKGYSLSNFGGTAGFDKYISKTSAGSNGTIDTTTNKVYYPATITNNKFNTLFSGDGLEVNANNKHVALTINGNTVEFDLTEGDYVGTAGMNSLVSQLQTGFAGSGVTVAASASTLTITTDAKGTSATISMSGANTSEVFSKSNNVAKESTVSRNDSRCTITSRNNISSITIENYNNKMSFDYATDVNGSLVTGRAEITVPAGTYTADTLKTALQTAIDNALGSDQLVVSNNNGTISIKGATPSDTRKISNFSGRLFDKVFQNVSYTGVSVHTEKNGTSLGSTLSYIVGRNSLEPSGKDEQLSGKDVCIYTDLNDTMIFDLNYGGQTHTIEFKIPAGDYTKKELADAIEQKGREEFAKITDYTGNSFPDDFFNASIGLSELGVAENNTGISSSDKLVLWCKLPDDGRNGKITAIIDGIRGNSAYRVFYDATRSPQPSTFYGKPDLSDGIVINDENDTLGFELDGVPASVDIPHGEYTVEELAEQLNNSFSAASSDVRVGHRNGRIMFYTIENGDFVFNKFTGSAANDIIYGGESRDEDTDIGIHKGRRTDDYIMYEKTRVDEHLMRINTTGVTTAERASKAINRLNLANDYLSKQRAVSGAYENRSEHALANRQNYIENLSAAESQIRDADMAKQYADYTKYQILNQTQNNIFGHFRNHQQSVLNIIA
ncbi:MAG: hypothetical protein IJC04_11950 [Oscillospiraceae bacterium]|nr:hypothetical protein [Oscillospiraceae bacterium]